MKQTDWKRTEEVEIVEETADRTVGPFTGVIAQYRKRAERISKDRGPAAASYYTETADMLENQNAC
jgi:hypothetical protein